MRRKPNPSEVISEKVIELLEKGITPWWQMWDMPLPRKFESQDRYFGFNMLYLYARAKEHKYTSPYWISPKQVTIFHGVMKPFSKPEIIMFHAKGVIGYHTIYNVAQTTVEQPEPTPLQAWSKQSYQYYRSLFPYHVDLRSEKELVANIGTAILCAEGTVDMEAPPTSIETTGWIEALKKDKKMFVRAAIEAQQQVFSLRRGGVL